MCIFITSKLQRLFLDLLKWCAVQCNLQKLIGCLLLFDGYNDSSMVAECIEVRPFKHLNEII